MDRDYAGALAEVRKHLRDELLPFWRERAVDVDYGGFLTCFDSHGEPTTDQPVRIGPEAGLLPT